MPFNFRAIADEIDISIRSGSLPAGARLPPQRTFAHEHGIAASTAGRVYADLVRRGLVTGEVGRGTFVRPPAGPRPGLLEAAADPVDLRVNFPVLEDQARLLAPAISRLARTDVLDAAIRPHGADGRGIEAQRDAVRAFLGVPEGRGVLFAGSGRQALGVAIATLVPPGGALAVERWTYPIALGLADHLGRGVVALDMDEDGVVPEAIVAAHGRRRFDAIYLQPTIHNPTTITMPPARRRAVAAIADRLGTPIVEDAVYRFLHPDPGPSLADLAADVVTVDSLSKRVAPGLSIGLLISSNDRLPALRRTGLEMGWTAPTFAIHAVAAWMADGTIKVLDHAKRSDAARRREIVRQMFGATDLRVRQDGYHIWLTLPNCCDRITLMQDLEDRGVGVGDGRLFAATATQPAPHLRLALSRPPMADLAAALEHVRDMAVDRSN